MEKYFVNSNGFLKAKNKLDEKLHEAFRAWVHYQIDELYLILFDELFEKVCTDYYATGGKCQKPAYRRSMLDSKKVSIHISETGSLILYPIKGELLPF